MLSNVYSKQEILDELSKKGYFIDAYTLDTFLEQWKIEAIYEDEESKEFFDKNTLDIILENLFKKEKEDESMKEEDTNTMPVLEDNESQEEQESNEQAQTEEAEQIETQPDSNSEQQEQQENSEPQQETNEANQTDNESANETNEQETEEDFDDISLISDSFEAQEKFREYVVSQLSKKNVDLTPKNEFKLDISEHTLNMIAKTLAKKITKYVGTICAADAKVAVQLEDALAKNEKLENKVEALEEQNRKLRILLTESNKNLNSYKPGLFGFYVKVPPNKK